jgi:molybdopterin-containing oxidoreductase family iron-sulfur binding subunit
MSQPPKTVKRREFLKVLGSTGAAATAVGCSMERVEQLIPYVVSPDHTVPGVSTHYATVCRECSAACGVIAETRDGRAIKLEGNPDHPVNHGALCARGQAALQGLYNPDRYRGPMIRRDNRLQPATWDEALARVRQGIDEARAANAAGGVRFVSQHENGSLPAFIDQWMTAGGFGSHLAFDPEADLAARAANVAEYGTAWPALDFTAARLIVSIGADFLDGWGASVAHQLSFADARAKLGEHRRASFADRLERGRMDCLPPGQRARDRECLVRCRERWWEYDDCGRRYGEWCRGGTAPARRRRAAQREAEPRAWRCEHA